MIFFLQKVFIHDNFNSLHIVNLPFHIFIKNISPDIASNTIQY